MMKTRLLFISWTIILLISVSGCTNWTCENLGWFCPDSINQPEVNTLQDIQNAHKTVEESSKTIEKASGEIADEANKITIEANEVKGQIHNFVEQGLSVLLSSLKEKHPALILAKGHTEEMIGDLVKEKFGILEWQHHHIQQI